MRVWTPPWFRTPPRDHMTRKSQTPLRKRYKNLSRTAETCRLGSKVSHFLPLHHQLRDRTPVRLSSRWARSPVRRDTLMDTSHRICYRDHHHESEDTLRTSRISRTGRTISRTPFRDSKEVEDDFSDTTVSPSHYSLFQNTIHTSCEVFSTINPNSWPHRQVLHGPPGSNQGDLVNAAQLQVWPKT